MGLGINYLYLLSTFSTIVKKNNLTDLSEFIFPAAVIEIDKLKIIFGNFCNRSVNTKENYLVLLTKFFIWRERCAKRLPNFIGLKIYIETHLKDLCLNSKFSGKYNKFCRYWGGVPDVFNVVLNDACFANSAVTQHHDFQNVVFLSD